MKYKSFLILTLLCSIFLISSVVGQNKTNHSKGKNIPSNNKVLKKDDKKKNEVFGTLVDISSKAPLEGVTIYNRNNRKRTYSNLVGTFTIQANKGDVLQFTLIAYKMSSVVVGEGKVVAVSLESTTSELSEVVTVGNRGSRRTKTESAVPVDIERLSQIGQATAKPNLSTQLNQVVPSFNYNKESGADGSDANDFGSLRGLDFDETLVLINGKRRHMSAFIREKGVRGRGNTGYDLNSIPEEAIEKVEILRDGASAQYGSDAMGGVINLILRENVYNLKVDIAGSGYNDHTYNTLNSIDPSQYITGKKWDGRTLSLGANYGIPIGLDGGFINFSANYIKQEKTFRQVPDTNLASNPLALPINTFRRGFGDGSIQAGGFFVNSQIPISIRTTAYFFGGYNYKLSNAFGYSRNFSNSGAIRFPLDSAGNLVTVPGIILSTKDSSLFYNPQEDVQVQDGSLATGIKGYWDKNWDWDFSNVIGTNDIHYFGSGTFNASLLPNILQSNIQNFDNGGFGFLQNTLNAEFTKHYHNTYEGISLTLGSEYRYENYKIYAGQPDSYNDGGATYTNAGTIINKAIGSQGFLGFQPEDRVRAHRNTLGAYGDLNIDFTKKWLLEAAIRLENYSDFGFEGSYKIASRYRLAPNLNVRASASTNYRAPSLQQINYSHSNYRIDPLNSPNLLIINRVFPNSSLVTKSLGIPSLKQEKSDNFSLGLTWNPVAKLILTVDGYFIKIKNRIVLTGPFDSTNAQLAPTLTINGIQGASFFANAVNSTHYGVDLVLDYLSKWGDNHFKALLATNIQNTTINKINIPSPFSINYKTQQEFFSTREQYFLKASAPKEKVSFGMEYGTRIFSIGTHLTYFGQVITQGFGYSALTGATTNGPGGIGISDQGNGWDPYIKSDNGNTIERENFVHKGKMETDLYLSLNFTKQFTAYFGLNNVFNVHPDLSVVSDARRASAYDSESGGPFDSIQMGFNGMQLFSKLSFSF